MFISDMITIKPIMCIMNTSDAAKAIDFAKYAERTAGFTKAQV
jgi:hypothetical protein